MSSLRPVVAGLLAVAPALAVSPPAEAQTRFREEASVVEVQIPVQVIRDGAPVRGLERGDFEVLDGRKKAEIVGFDVVDLAAGSGDGPLAAAALPVAARRHFVFLFDLSFSEPQRALAAQEAARQLVREGLHPSDLAAVATFAANRGVEVPLGFTTDRAQLEAAIGSFGLESLIDPVRDPLGISILERQNVAGSDPSTQGIFNPEPEIIAAVERLTGGEERAGRRDRMLALTGGLAQLGELVASVDAAKHVVLFSEGFDASVLIGTGVGTAEEQERIRETSEAAIEGRIWDVGEDDRFGASGSQSVLDGVVEALQRAQCTIQAVDVGGLRAGGEATGASADSGSRSAGQDGLFLLADRTGGELFRNFNRLDQAMDEVLERTSVTYVLSIEPRELKADGRFHPLKVRLKDGGRGVRVLHRPGYFAPSREAAENPMEARLRTAALILGGDEGGTVATSALAAAFDFGGPTAYVPLLIEMEGADLLAGQGGDVLPAEIFVYAIDAGGSVVDYFTRAVGLDLTKVRGALEKSGFKYWGHLDLPPGDYLLRILARNSATGRYGLRKLPLAVPAAGEALLMPPLVPEAPGTWILGRESAEEQADVPYPFLLGEEPFIPAARPTLVPGRAIAIALMGYGLGSGGLEVRAELVGAGAPAAVGAEVVSRSAAGPGPERLELELSPGSPAAGDYRLVVSVADATGGTLSSEIPVRIAG